MSKPVATLTFLGAARTVTGSKFLLDLNERRLMVDAGMFQGAREWRRRNWDDFPVDPATITDLLITHAHMDHSGYIPALVKHGFHGRIHCTPQTRELTAIVLRDSANLQVNEARDAARGGYSKHNPPLPLYDEADVERSLPLFHDVAFDRDLDLGGGVHARFTRAGHILGSASIRVWLADDPQISVLFSGDLGRDQHPVLRRREEPEGATSVLIESTYGNREHPTGDEEDHEPLAGLIRRTIARGGSVLIPAFAVDRTEIVIKVLGEMQHAGRIPPVPIFINSPMGSAALDVYQGTGAHAELRADIDISALLNLPTLRDVRTKEESVALNRPAQPCIIISASGMATGGRVVHHLRHMLPDPRNAVVFTGYQALGTRGRSLVEGAKQIKMYGRYVPVKAEVLLDTAFSVHADAPELLEWLAALSPAPQVVYCVHGEPKSAEHLADTISEELGLMAVVPRYGEVVRL
ncbi:MBL fold metallo-hydrolase RNA specificity domain-containing protein [Propionibacterium freudenreichii]|uniref:MBL fold metallo-hydrolase RNA specificity domain-containing protein n=1 Tax=Propionibacterium freudenreichii TaxID=1744 RepID=UPI0005439781|nr:MBL fold metallo-hydrolase [Propionibacterium freudenreichii]AJQ89882.1 Putative exonuclease of the beta-lactamase fold involved in RNA processing [Propionibacterium freudenreichii subsp. freudenreichii]MDK9342718.1 MBL fold metallo-hydrolase [Propionibacterium freudenreichii]CEG91013.1 exonuclease of the beta-lactamase fold involved in RNA processing [Propionibacterium freudenreichii]